VVRGIPGLLTTQAEYPRSGTRISRALGRWLLALLGWRVEGRLPQQAKFVIVVAPHTSNWDFLIGLFAKFALGLRASWLGKHTLFRFPLGPVLRWLGGEPVDRSAPQGTVGTAIEHFRSRPQWVLALSPEGTRRPVPVWKTGFQRIAAGAGVPIVPVWLDYRSRTVGIGAPIAPAADEATGVAQVRALYHKEMARHPDLFVEREAP
jgi:1-acyl-sn-glycerol-3-phosphate acyltransferase